MSVARIYTRLSRDRDEQTSTARQEAECRALAARLGATEVVVYAEEPGTSGYADVARPERDRMMSDLLPGDFVLCWALDRMGRRGLEDTGRILREVEEARARLVTVSDGVDTAQDFGELNIGLRAILAREESKKIAARVRSAKRLARNEGKWLGGPPPYGLRLRGDGKVEHDPETAPIARRIAEEALSGKTLYAIAQGLTADEIPSPSGNGKWWFSSIRQILRSPAFAGLQADRRRTDNGRWVAVADVFHNEAGETVSVGEGIITPQERTRLMRVLDSRTTATGSLRKDGEAKRVGRRASQTLLTGVLRCAHCDAPGVAGGTKEYAQYRCSSLSNAPGRCSGFVCPRPATDDAVSKAFLTRLAALDEDDPLLPEIAARWVEQTTPEVVEERREAENAVSEAKAALRRIQDLAAIGVLTLDEAAERTPEARRRVALAEVKLAEVAPVAVDISVLLDTVLSAEAWENLPTEEKRPLIALAVSRVTVTRAPRRGVRFQSCDRLIITWNDGTTTVPR